MLSRSGRVGTIYTSAAEVRDRSRGSMLYATISRSPFKLLVLIPEPGGDNGWGIGEPG